MADSVRLLRVGRVEAEAAPEELYVNPTAGPLCLFHPADSVLTRPIPGAEGEHAVAGGAS
jgi:hypothetical protein